MERLQAIMNQSSSYLVLQTQKSLSSLLTTSSSSSSSCFSSLTVFNPLGAALPLGMTDVNLEQEMEAEGGVFLLVVAFIVLEVDGNSKITTEEAAFSEAAVMAMVVVWVLNAMSMGCSSWNDKGY